MNDVIARSGDSVITPGARVTLHFSLLFCDGAEIDTTRNGKPATFVVGDGSLLPGFEAVLIGKQTGYAAQVTLPAVEAFGEHNPANVQLIHRDKFFDVLGEMPLEEGLVVSFHAADGELPGVIVGLYEESVKVDFNHPLSGKSIIFDVSVLAVEAPRLL